MGYALCAASIDHHFSVCLWIFVSSYFSLSLFNAHSSSFTNFLSLLNLHLYTRFDYVSFEITISKREDQWREKKEEEEKKRENKRQNVRKSLTKRDAFVQSHRFGHTKHHTHTQRASSPTLNVQECARTICFYFFSSFLSFFLFAI